MTQMTKDHCQGCRDNFYNRPAEDKECWMFPDAVLIQRKIVHIDQRPPWNQKPQLLPNCYRLDRHVIVSPERTT